MKNIQDIIGKIHNLIQAENGRVKVEDVELVLAENFEFTGSKEGKEQIKNKVDWLKGIPKLDVHRELNDPHDIVPESVDTAVIKSIVTTATTDQTKPKSILGRYRNIHVFKKENGNWHCIYWQVTKLET
jgi:hypothetical protein